MTAALALPARAGLALSPGMRLEAPHSRAAPGQSGAPAVPPAQDQAAAAPEPVPGR
jgi:hypothetical protein